MFEKAIEDFSFVLENDLNYVNAYTIIGEKKKVADDYNMYLKIRGNRDGMAKKIR